jgi:peptidoglycan/LPS O-acetylase OafA/YrhL
MARGHREDRLSDRLHARLARVTTTGLFIPEIDGLRFVAIMSVVIFHLDEALATLNPTSYGHGPLHVAIDSGGGFGVQLFFVVSGFVLALPFAAHWLRRAKKVALRQYFLRRVTRLEPPYFAAMFLAFALLVATGKSEGLLGHLAASLFYAHGLVFGTESPVNNVTWSLEVEIQFYLLVPWLTSVFRIRDVVRRRMVLCGAIVLGSTLGSWLAGTTPHLEHSILAYSQYFLVGFLMADLMLADQLRPRSRNALWDLAALVAFAGMAILHKGAGFTNWNEQAGGGAAVAASGVLPWLVLLAYVAVFRGVAANALLTQRWVTVVGGMCYSIYLLHNLIISRIVGHVSGSAPTGQPAVDLAAQVMVVVPVVIACCTPFFVLIERPCMDKNWPRKLRDRLRRGRGDHLSRSDASSRVDETVADHPTS